MNRHFSVFVDFVFLSHFFFFSGFVVVDRRSLNAPSVHVVASTSKSKRNKEIFIEIVQWMCCKRARTSIQPRFAWADGQQSTWLPRGNVHENRFSSFYDVDDIVVDMKKAGNKVSDSIWRTANRWMSSILIGFWSAGAFWWAHVCHLCPSQWTQPRLEKSNLVIDRMEPHSIELRLVNAFLLQIQCFSTWLTHRQ